MSRLPREDASLIALLALFAPAGAEALLSRLVGGDEAARRAQAARSVAASRSDRLAALAALLSDEPPPRLTAEGLLRATREERPGTISALHARLVHGAVAAVPGPGDSALLRLLHDRLRGGGG